MPPQILEFASVNLKNDISPTDPRILSVFRTCLDELTKGGGTHFRFLSSTPENIHLEKQIVVMIGIWPTVELHSQFIESGILMPLMASLADLISMREVIYLRIPAPDTVREKVLGAENLITAYFHVDKKGGQEFEDAVQGVLGAKKDCVKGWNSTEGDSFEKSEHFRRGRLEQDESDVKHEGVWGVLLQKEDGNLMDGIKKATENKYERVEQLSWEALAC